MAGDEVHGGVFALPGLVDIPGAHHPEGGGLGAARVPLEVAAHVVPVAAVPLRPAVPGGEAAHLVEPPGVPGLGDELHVPQDGVEGHGLEEGGFVHRAAVLVPAQDRGQVKAEAADMVGGHPVAQAVDDHLVDNGVVAVQGVPAAAEIVVLPAGGK